VKALLIHLRERQADLGVNAFRFTHVLRNNEVEGARYPEVKRSTSEEGTVDSATNDPLATPIRKAGKPKKSPRKKSVKKSPRKKSVKAKDAVEVNKNGDSPVVASSSAAWANNGVPPSFSTPHGLAPITPGAPSLQASTPTAVLSPLSAPAPLHLRPPQMMPPVTVTATAPSQPPPNYNGGVPQFDLAFMQNCMAFMMQQQSGLGASTAPVQHGYDVFNPPPAGDGYRPWNSASETRLPHIDPQLLPPGQPIFTFPPPINLPNMGYQHQHRPPESNVKHEERGLSRATSPSPLGGMPTRRTPKRKRLDGDPPDDSTPRRSNRKKTSRKDV
jgi:hypothetical protein